MNLSVEGLVLAGSLALSFSFLVYGMNILHLTRRARRYRNPPYTPASQRPAVAVHLPIYNELYVVERLIDSCIQMAHHYGRELVRIMVIDDSTDETRDVVDRLVKQYSAEGYRIEVIRRGTRRGFKAGALQAALERTWEEFIAIFDADFAPPPNFLEVTIPHLLQDPAVGFVQCRWDHFNRCYNGITKTISIGVDAHFVVEQAGRWASGYLINFNGSAGVLRREAIIRAGGWCTDTLAEDLDLSYRIQLQGYRAVYLRDMTARSELPPTIMSLKRQQGRWARGSLQAARKLMGQVVSSSLLSPIQKFEAALHLTYYLVHPLMVASFGLAVLATFLHIDVIRYAVEISLPRVGSLDDIANALSRENVAYFTFSVAPWLIFAILVLVSTCSVLLYCIQALRMQKMSLLKNLKHLILLVIIGYGISISNSVHALAGLLSRRTGTFRRTPKYHIAEKSDRWRGKKYQIPMDKITAIEGAAAALAGGATYKALLSQNIGILPILVIYLLGYGLVFGLSLAQTIHITGSAD
jgi:cellulose synthase/poly-beta-1,6-N-acetylglucosamine synthase-like glycosyltransferase